MKAGTLTPSQKGWGLTTLRSPAGAAAAEVAAAEVAAAEVAAAEVAAAEVAAAGLSATWRAWTYPYSCCIHCYSLGCGC